MPMSAKQARVIDPILSNVALGYSNGDFIGDHLFPFVDVGQRGGRVIKFDKAAFRRYNARRAPGSATKRIQIGYGSDPIALVQDALEGLVPIEDMEEAQEVPGIDLASLAINDVMDSILLALEYDRAQIALDANNYDVNHKDVLAGTDKWSDDASAPGKKMDTYREAIRSSIGRYPNVLALSATAFNAAKHNPTIKAQFKYVSKDSITEAMLAEYFNVKKVVVGTSIEQPEDAADDTDFNDIWGNNAVLAYVPEQRTSHRIPSYGYTYRLRGRPMVEEPYYAKNAKSWVYPTTYDRKPYMTSMAAGFLIQNPA